MLKFDILSIISAYLEPTGSLNKCIMTNSWILFTSNMRTINIMYPQYLKCKLPLYRGGYIRSGQGFFT